MLWTPLNVMQGVYIKYYGFSMGLMAAILLASRVYDAIADMAVGALSDWRKAKTGQRKPLFALGAVIFAVAGVFVYVPPQGVGTVYLTFWLFTFFSGYATVLISYLAWGAELAHDSRAKTELFSVRTAAGYTGLCLFYSMPLLPIFATSQITPETIKWAVYLAVGMLIPALIVALKFVPEGAMAAPARGQSVISRESLRALITNRPFLALMAAYLLGGSGLGIWYGMIFIFVDIYLKQGAMFAPIYLVAFGVGAVSSLAWSRVAARFGKKAAWSAGMGLALATEFGTHFLNAGNADTVSIGLILIVNTIGLVSFELLPGSILGDVADYSLMKTARNQAGTYFSVYMFMTKVLFALGGAIGLGLAAWMGFDPHAEVQSVRGVFALSMVMSWVPSVLLAGAIVLIHLIPMDERRHAIVRKRLDQREARLCARPAS